MTLKQILPISLMALAAAGAQAVPAYPGLITTTQPDGTSVSLRLMGDEHFSWARSADGFTLLRDAKGYWTVAKPDASGILKPTDMKVAGHSAAAQAATLGVAPMLPISEKTRDALTPMRSKQSDLQVDCSFPTTGRRKLLMLLVNFADTRPTYSKSDFDGFMNGNNWGGVGSFRDFYLENSYGKLDINTTVTRWITLPSPKNAYTIDNVGDMIKYALEEISGEINLGEFDNDGDGIIDGLAIIHQGPGQEATGSTADIWSHSSTLYGLSVDGMEVRRYTIQPETFGTSANMSSIGVMCHEFGHNLGAPDFYDTDYEQNGGEYGGTGVWDLLGSGAWNGEHGDRPAHVNMWQKIMFGWVTPQQLNETMSVTDFADATYNAAAYRFDTTAAGDYFILENRQQTGNFNCALPGHGLIITHVNEGLIAASVVPNTVNAAFPQACYTVAANADAEPSATPSSYGYPNNANALFGVEKTSFGDATTPSSHAVDGRCAYKRLDNIAENTDGSMRFDFVVEEAPGAPRNLIAGFSDADVHLSWEAPEDAEGLENYNVFRNGTLIGTVTETEYVDVAPSVSGRIEYYVDARYSDGLVSPPVYAAIRIPAAKVTKVTGAQQEQSVRLSWEVDPNISRMKAPGSVSDDYQLCGLAGASIEYAHRFTPEELTVYQGNKIRRIAFVPYFSLQESKYTIKVYETDPDGSNAELVSSRELKELGTGIWNTILLTKAVEILPGKGYMIAVEMQPTNNVIQVLTEYDNLHDGYGNLVRYDGGDWTTDNLAVGNFLLYAVLADVPSEGPAEVTDNTGDIDPDQDLYFPIGFRVYRNGQYVGETSSRAYIDSPLPDDGKYTYTVTTLYKGDNETAPSSPIEVTITNSGVMTITGSETPDSPLYRLNGTRAPADTKGILVRKGEKILK